MAEPKWFVYSSIQARFPFPARPLFCSVPGQRLYCTMLDTSCVPLPTYVGRHRQNALGSEEQSRSKTPGLAGAQVGRYRSSSGHLPAILIVTNGSMSGVKSQAGAVSGPMTVCARQAGGQRIGRMEANHQEPSLFPPRSGETAVNRAPVGAWCARGWRGSTLTLGLNFNVMSGSPWPGGQHDSGAAQRLSAPRLGLAAAHHAPRTTTEFC